MPNIDYQRFLQVVRCLWDGAERIHGYVGRFGRFETTQQVEEGNIVI